MQRCLQLYIHPQSDIRDLVDACLALQNDSPELLAHATGILEGIETSFATWFEQAIESGEISAEKESTELARYLQIQIIGLRTYAQVTRDEAAVERYIDDIFKNIV